MKHLKLLNLFEVIPKIIPIFLLSFLFVGYTWWSSGGEAKDQSSIDQGQEIDVESSNVGLGQDDDYKDAMGQQEAVSPNGGRRWHFDETGKIVGDISPEEREAAADVQKMRKLGTQLQKEVALVEASRNTQSAIRSVSGNKKKSSSQRLGVPFVPTIPKVPEIPKGEKNLPKPPKTGISVTSSAELSAADVKKKIEDILNVQKDLKHLNAEQTRNIRRITRQAKAHRAALEQIERTRRKLGLTVRPPTTGELIAQEKFRVIQEEVDQSYNFLSNLKSLKVVDEAEER